ncbi:MAG: SemiSWEET family sugar transporter [Beijerinckiaceae bacterium]
MTPVIFEWIGGLAAFLTTLSWLPQAVRTIRTKQTRDLSLWAQILLFIGIILWLVYGIYIVSWPLIGGNVVTLVLVSIILAMKLKHG